MHESGERAVPRRKILKALALAPAAATVGCAAARAEQAGPGKSPAAERGEAASAAAAIRSLAVPSDAEPAFVFRAAAARPGDLR